MIIQHKFIEFIPDTLEDGILYISMENAVAVHRCFCGCGVEVNTPLSPHGWTLSFDGDTVSLSPSIGSRSLLCQSHYLLQSNQVVKLGWYDNEKWGEPKKKVVKKRKKRSWFRRTKK